MVRHFVSIIIRAMHSIRIFFFVFTGGLLAFATAILHIFHTCVDAEHCSYYTDGFSPNLFRALSMTYFMVVRSMVSKGRCRDGRMFKSNQK
jgi:hypothetical protein